MASLYVTANNARKVVIIILGIAILIILVDTFIRFGPGSNPVTPTDKRFYVNPDKALGDVGVPVIPSITIDNSSPTITLESASLDFPDVSYVYRIEKPSEKSNTFVNASKTASALGFSATGFQNLGNNDFRWATTDASKVLNFNKLSQVWSFNTIYENNVDAKKKKTLNADINTYINRVPTILNSLLFASSLGFTTPKIDARYLIRTGQGDISETQDSKLANYIKLNVYRKLPQSDLKPATEQPKLASGQIKPQATSGYVYTVDPRVGEFSAVVSNDATTLSKDLFEMKFTNFDYGTKGSYYIVTPDEAFSRIQKGQGSLVALSAEGTDYFEPYVKLNVTKFIVDARKTELGFYEPQEWTGYVYPIYILSGRAELNDGRLAKFTIYVDAIKRLDS